MNINKMLTNEILQEIIINKPKVAHFYLVSKFIFDLVMLFLSVIGFFFIWMYKPEFILVYLVNSALFVYYFINVVSMRHYINHFIVSFSLHFFLIKFYGEADENQREVLKVFCSTLPKEFGDIYSKGFKELEDK